MDPRFAAMIADNLDKLKRHCAPGCPFLVDDERDYSAGEILRQPELA